MSAFIVDREHIDLMVSTALHGTRGEAVSPDTAWRQPSWPAVDWPELAEMGWQETAQQFHRVNLAPIGTDDLSPDELGLLLVSENVASVSARYPRDTIEELPGPIDTYYADYTYTDHRYRLTAVEALALLDCYEYQSCEHDGWRASEAFRFCDAMRRAITHHLPGRRDAPWRWNAHTITERRAGV